MTEFYTFKLPPSFVEQYKGKQPNWGPVGYITYKRTYARVKDDGTTEEFWETCKRVVEGCYNVQKKHCNRLGLHWDNIKAKKSASEMFERMWDFKFLPPGRGLWMMGSSHVDKVGAAALQNCFSGDTEIITDEGIKCLSVLSGTSPTLLTENGKWVKAPIKNFGKQNLYRLTLRRQGITKEIYTTADHVWYARDRRTAYRDKGFIKFSTKELRPDVHHLQYSFGSGIKNITPSPLGVTHGFFFGDGGLSSVARGSNTLTLCADKDRAVLPYFSSKQRVNKDGKYIQVLDIPNFYKDLPSIKENKTYLFGWLSGYFAADGTVKSNGQAILSSSSLENLKFVRDVASVLGIGVYSIRKEERISNLTKKPHTMYSICFMRDTLTESFFIQEHHKKRFNISKVAKSWTVVSVEKTDRVEEVFCAVVKDYNKFTLEGNILTGNCGFLSTESLVVDFAEPFCWLMDMLMLGVGVGFDTKGAGIVKIQEPKQTDEVFVVEDSREGWVSLLHRYLSAYAGRGGLPKEVDYSKVRPAGSAIRGFGGTASGHGPLEELIKSVQDVLEPLIGEKITSTAIVDIANLVGRCVVSGNVRRSAELSLGDPNDEEFLSLKDPVKNQDALYSHRWASNNSILATVGMDYNKVAQLTAKNGEPGYVWLDNAKAFSRMNGKPDNKDRRAAGVNPCVSGDTLVETEEGWKTVNSLIGNKFSAVVDGGVFPSTSAGFFPSGTKQVFLVETSDGYKVKATGNHKFLLKGKEEKWVAVEDLKVGDNLVVSNNRKYKHGTYSSKDRANGYLVGHLLGDGTINQSKAVFSTWEKDGPGISSMMETINSSIELLGVPHRSDWKSWTLVPDRGEYRLNSSPLYYLFKKSYGMDVGTKIPEDLTVFEDKGKAFYVGFIQGLFDTDGSVQGTQKKGVSIRLTQVSLPLLETVQRMLLSFGIASSIYKGRKPSGLRKMPDGKGGLKEYFCNEIHELIISKNNIGLFSQEIGFNHTDKQEALDFILETYKRTPYVESFRSKIVSITPVGEEPVFDCTIPEVNRFCANGVIVHNCAEQILEDMELCCLVETFPSRHDSYEDFEKTLKYAYLYAKSVTLVPTHNEKTNQILLRNRRIGTSISGIVQAMQRHGRRAFLNWCDTGYSFLKDLDKIYSDWLCVRESIKITTVKPSGSVSLLPQVTPGIHFPHSEHYIRRIRFQEESPLVAKLTEAGYKVEVDKYSPKTVVVEFPVKEEYFDRAKKDVTMWEQLELAAQMQEKWSDNAVSATVTFSPSEREEIAHALELYETRLKSISFLPMEDHGYEQAPYEEITEQEYTTLVAGITPILGNGDIEHEVEEKFCTTDTCLL